MALSVLQKYQAKIPDPNRFARESGSKNLVDRVLAWDEDTRAQFEMAKKNAEKEQRSHFDKIVRNMVIPPKLAAVKNAEVLCKSIIK